MARLFGTDGVRGVVGSELTPELALRLGRAIGVVFGKGSRILLGRDVRAGGDLLAKAVASGLQAEMVKVYNAGLLPTPALQYMVKSEGFDGGVMITASHNPPEYNGIKVVDSDGIEISREKERVIEEHYFKGTASVTEWRALVASEALHTGALERYIEAIIQHVDPQVIAKRGFKVVVDCANSVGALVTPKLLSLLKAKPITINCDLNPEFPGREPEPTPDSLRLASL
ncbi:MAG: phosphoglucosamine mutase, partial [Desulfurococcales archaeon]|nr:phosphoglucosamine mutase [Desulfurococcales archaeon]